MARVSVAETTAPRIEPAVLRNRRSGAGSAVRHGAQRMPFGGRFRATAGRDRNNCRSHPACEIGQLAEAVVTFIDITGRRRMAEARAEPERLHLKTQEMNTIRQLTAGIAGFMYEPADFDKLAEAAASLTAGLNSAKGMPR